jgi:phosphatidylinositol glycan class O
MAFGKILIIVLATLLGAYASNGLIILMVIAVGCLFIFSVLRFESSSDLKECLQPTFSLIITWYLLYSYGFYCTSHQPTISQIDWNAAFVGRTANYDHSNFISALLVLTSTFNANIILLVLYPLMVLFPFMLYALYPQLCSSGVKNKNSSEYKRVTLNTDNEDDEKASSVANVTRGEINLFEHEKLFMSSVFKVGCQLIILQGTKAFASMIACTILCRHLMVWKIFAPRFIYEGIASYITFIAIIVGFLILIRVHKSVKKLVDKVSKNC